MNATRSLQVHFVLSRKFFDRYWADLDQLLARKATPDEMPERFIAGRDVWVIQTLLELNARYSRDGELSYGFSSRWGALNLLHCDDFGSRSACWKGDAIVVRADRPPVRGADWVVIQSSVTPQDGPHRYIPHWPQPGLIPHPSREEPAGPWRAVYFGRTGAFPEAFRSARLVEEARRRGIEIEFREREWWNYRDVDVAISFREMPHEQLLAKPPSKLVNAWIAGVPMVCDGEPSFAALRESCLDYLQAATPEELLSHLEWLRSDFTLRRAMVAQGRRRAEAFSRDAVLAAWVDFLENLPRKSGALRRLLGRLF